MYRHGQKVTKCMNFRLSLTFQTLAGFTFTKVNG